MPPGPLSGAAAWRGEDMVHSDEWAYRLSAADLEEIEAALAAVEASGTPLFAIRRKDFPLPRLAGTLDGLRADILRGRGFQLLQGLPVER